jgi:hypothetical protein
VYFARPFLLLSAFAAGSAAAEAPVPPASEVSSAFFISKSQNRNQVHYAVAVDASCTPLGVAPVRPYWRLLEQGPAFTAPLLEREQRGYGIASQNVLRRTASGGSITLTLNPLPKRPLTITTGKDSTGACRAWVYTVIQNEPALLHGIHVVLGWLGLSIDSLIIKGWAKSDRRVLRETITP